MTQNFQKHIQDWVTLDNQLKNLQQEVKVIRANRNDLTGEIFTYAEQNNLENAVIQITDGKLKFHNVKQTSPLTWGLVKDTLMEFFGDGGEKEVEKIIQRMKSKRDIRYAYDIKRTYK